MKLDLTFEVSDATFMAATDYLLEDVTIEGMTAADALYYTVAALLDEGDATIHTFINAIPEDTKKELVRQFYNNFIKRLSYTTAERLGLNP